MSLRTAAVVLVLALPTGFAVRNWGASTTPTTLPLAPAEVQAQRELADRAEASLFTELRGFIGEELARLASRSDAGIAQVNARAPADRIAGTAG